MFRTVGGKSMAALLTVIIAICMIGCAGSGNIKTPDQMTPVERATLVLTLYNNAYTNYLAQYNAAAKPLTPDMQTYFRGYKEGMTIAWPTISAYVSTVQVGGTPTPEQEAQIIGLIYKLQGFLTKGGK